MLLLMPLLTAVSSSEVFRKSAVLMSTFDSNALFNTNCLSMNSCLRSFIPWATENPKVVNMPKNKILMVVWTIDQKYQLNPLKIRYIITAIGNARNGSKNKINRYPEDLRPLC